MKFTQLNLVSPLLKALENDGFTEATKIQEQVIPDSLDGKDILGCAQTGSGKTLAFALPTLQRLYNIQREEERERYEENQRDKISEYDEEKIVTKKRKKKNKHIRHIKSLILAPTRELAIQISDTFGPYCINANIKHTVIYGGKSQFHQVKALEKGVDILIATPGRLLDLINQGYVKLNSIEVFILDEADKMLEMGFLEDIQKVIKMLPSKKQTLFFSATMPPKIKTLADTILENPVEVTIDRVASTGSKINQEVFFVDQAQKRHLLQYLVKKPEFDSIIVFVKTKDDTESVLNYILAAGIEADNIHRNRSQNARERALNKLKDGEIKVLVATDIASRGIDIDNLSLVINYDLPQEPETYVHRIGRTARAGKNGCAISFCVDAQKPKLEQIEELIGQTISVSKNLDYMKEVVAKSRVIGKYSESNKQYGTGGGKKSGGGGAKKKRLHGKKKMK